MFNSLKFRWMTLGLACVAMMATQGRGFASETLQDPTQPPDSYLIEGTGVRASSASPYRLSAILVAKGRRIAVINGRPVQAGDHVSNVKVIRILQDKVVLRASTGDLTIELISTSIKAGEGAGK